jgi:hypothetical protein
MDRFITRPSVIYITSTGTEFHKKFFFGYRNTPYTVPATNLKIRGLVIKNYIFGRVLSSKLFSDQSTAVYRPFLVLLLLLFHLFS